MILLLPTFQTTTPLQPSFNNYNHYPLITSIKHQIIHLNLCKTLNPSSINSSRSTHFHKLSAYYSCSRRRSSYNAVENDGDSFRISPVGDWRVSIVPILDHWIQEGRNVNKVMLQRITWELRKYRRYAHSLEVSEWMSDRMYLRLSPADMAIRLDLIYKVHGIDQALIYFNNITGQMKDVEVYGALLRCYAEEKSLERAEDVMQEIRALGLEMNTISYNVMLNLYCKTGNYEKAKSLMHEMEEKGIKKDKVTYSIQLTACSSSSDNEEIDLILQKIESDHELVLDWNTYIIAANVYMKLGCVDKALEMLEKAEGLILTCYKKNTGFNFLITQYSNLGNKAEVMRVWELYKNVEKMNNSGYKRMIPSVLKFDDVKAAEDVFVEWESSQLTYDFRIPNFLIGYYCRKGLMGKAEALLDRAKRDGKPTPQTWYYFATGYIGSGQLPEAVEAMKRAISKCQRGWKQPSTDILIACLEYLKKNKDVKEVEEFIRSLVFKDIVSAETEKELLDYSGISKEDRDSNKSSERALIVVGEVREP
ncbi:Pentatricopeptide repeat-containing protein, mitochondrial [Heracleum sosnowskyi]|uniref:Pentatricopeptide repeat-containing protein, mitochondrial n=1 Tax=Heracleum sosnowskyi TaxID=360622 RepID=A0AAD8MK34_9APIA|nr:Pentatricopeptide repeat-containing protein, mitochondrial [Heracleum sosnowskyi]